MKIEQMLHGYDNGHRLLAGSVLLKNSMDMDAVATMSDWSEYVDGGDSSYLTAYPLKESGYYVVARTWYAEEMKRPGCVWTHSLLIPFESLNGIDDFNRLRTLFVRPGADEIFDSYSHTIEYENKNYSADDYEVLKADRKLVGQVLLCFLNTEGQSISMGVLKDKATMDRLMFAVMNVLPHDFLKGLSWCTGTAYQRKLNGIPLTWQFLTREADRIIGTERNEERWMTYVLDGILRGDVNQGQLLRMFSEDIQDKKDNYTAIVNVLYTLEDYFKTGEGSAERYGRVLKIIAGNFPSVSEGTVIKKLCANKTFSDRYCKNEQFFYYFCTLPLDGVFDVAETKVEERWNTFVEKERNNYLLLLSKVCETGNVNDWGKKALKESVDVLSDDEVMTVFRIHYHLFTTISLLNSSLLNKIQWNKLEKEEIETLLPMILDNRTRSDFSQWEELFKASLTQSVDFSDQLAKAIFDGADSAVGILLDYTNSDSSRYVGVALGRQLINCEKNVLQWLKGRNSITDNVAYAISNAVNERSSEVVVAGAKIWKPFLGLQFHNLRQEEYAFLFILSFNWLKDADALELMRMSFYPLHTLQANGQLKYNVWSQILPYLDSLFFWEDWDKCKKLRKTVVRRLKEAGMGRNVVEHFTPDNELNELLVKMW